MIVQVENGRIKNIKISCASDVLGEGEIFVSDDWGTDEILGFLFNEEHDIKMPDFAIGKNPNNEFSLFEIISVENILGHCIKEDPDSEFSLWTL